MKTTLSFFLLLSLVWGVSGQRTVPEQMNYEDLNGHAIGAILSSASGKGLAYRYWPGKMGIHVSFIPVKTSEMTYVSAGLGGYLTMFQEGNKRLFLHLGTEFVTEKNEEITGFSPNTTAVVKTGNQFNVGVGPGVEIMSGHFIFDLFMGYGVYNRFGDYDGDSPLYNLSGGVGMYFAL